MNVQPLVANDPDLIPTNPKAIDGQQLSALFESEDYLAGYLKAKERERIRFSRELHDSIGQLLLALRLDVAKLARTTPSGLAEVIHEVQCDAHEIEDKVRALAFLHYPAELSRDGLPVALQLRHRLWQTNGNQSVLSRRGRVQLFEVRSRAFPVESRSGSDD